MFYCNVCKAYFDRFKSVLCSWVLNVAKKFLSCWTGWEGGTIKGQGHSDDPVMYVTNVCSALTNFFSPIWKTRFSQD